MLLIKDIVIQDHSSMAISFNFLKFENKYAYMINEIIRGLVSNNFSIDTSFGYNENYDNENIYKAFKNKEEIDFFIVKYEVGNGFDIGAVYKPKKA